MHFSWVDLVEYLHFYVIKSEIKSVTFLHYYIIIIVIITQEETSGQNPPLHLSCRVVYKQEMVSRLQTFENIKVLPEMSHCD